LPGDGETHAAPRNLRNKTDYLTLGAGCVGYTEGFSTERNTFTDQPHGLTKKTRRNEAHKNLKGCQQEEMPPLTKDFDFHELGWFTEPSLIYIKRFLVTPVRPPTVCVSCGGWEGGLTVETEKLKATQKLKKRAAYPPSAARCVGWRWLSAFFL
jgi:hypothetical protein